MERRSEEESPPGDKIIGVKTRERTRAGIANHGYALIFSLWAIVIFGFIAVSFTRNTSIAIKTEIAFTERVKNIYAARGACLYATQKLLQSNEQGHPLDGLARFAGRHCTDHRRHAQVFDAAGYEIIIIETVGAGQSEVDIARLAHTTLVVEAPGLGDEIQAIKAGILVIAYVLVINKADHPGVENTERALRTTLELAHPTTRVFRHHGQAMTLPAAGTDSKLWIPPINKTIATEGKGIAELTTSIAKHAEHLRQSGDWAARDDLQSRYNDLQYSLSVLKTKSEFTDSRNEKAQIERDRRDITAMKIQIEKDREELRRERRKLDRDRIQYENEKRVDGFRQDIVSRIHQEQ